MNAISSRKLSAILFADIAGYTAMMQKDETEAMDILATFQSSVGKWVIEYGGEIIKNYGDSSICLFPSTNACIRCAYAIQLEVIPKVPLRIGLHLGDVLYKEGDVYGDDINIASRIESMGVPGNILVSESYYKRVKNQADLKFQSIGRYEFKNVEEPIEVFALDMDQLKIPKSHEIVGKNKPIQVTAFNPLWGLMIIVMIMVGYALIPIDFSRMVAWISGNVDHEPEVSTVAVLNFENNTGDPELDMVGKMAADRIIHGITQNDLARVVTSEALEQYDKMLLASVAPGDKYTMLDDRFDVKQVISGSYYLNGEVLMFQCTIIDPETKKIIKGLDPVECASNDPLQCIEKIRKAILGYVAIYADRDIDLVLETHIPNYEAYKELMKAKAADSNEEMLIHLDRAVALDSNYFEPKLLQLSAYYNLEQFAVADSLLTILNRNATDYDKRQQNLLSFYDALMSGKNDLINNYFKNEYDIAPFDLMTNNTQIVLALEFINDARAAIPMYEVIPEDDLDYANCGNCRTRLYLKLLMDLENGDPETGIATALKLRKNGGGNFGRSLLIRSYVQAQQWEKMEEFIESEGMGTRGKDLFPLYHWAAGESVLQGHMERVKKYAELARDNFTNGSDTIQMVKVLIILKAWEEAKDLLSDYLENQPDDYAANAYLAGIYLQQSAMTEAEKYIEILNDLRAPFQFGVIDYRLAQAYMIGGNTDKALDYLKVAAVNGQRYIWSQFDNDYIFAPILDDPRMEGILRYWQ